MLKANNFKRKSDHSFVSARVAKKPHTETPRFSERIKDRVQLADALNPIIPMGSDKVMNTGGGGIVNKWNGGSAVQWNLIKQKLILRFQAENCWHMLNGEEIELPEIPDEESMVEAIIKTLNENNDAALEKKLERLSAYEFEDEMNPKIMERRREDSYAKYEDEQLRIANSRPIHRAQVRAEIKAIEDQIIRIKADTSKCIKVLERCLGPGPMSYIGSTLNEGRVATAWKMLDSRYNDPRQTGSLSQVSQTLSTMEFDPFKIQFDEFVATFEMLVETLAKAEQPVSEPDKLGKLRSSIERGSKIFDGTLALCLFLEHDYEHTKNAIKLKIGELNRRDFENNIMSNHRSHTSFRGGRRSDGHRGDVQFANQGVVTHKETRSGGNHFQGKCFRCGMYGHKAENCHSSSSREKSNSTSNSYGYKANIECFKCGNKGHIARDCWKKKPTLMAQNRNASYSLEGSGKGKADSSDMAKNSGGEPGNVVGDLSKLFCKKVDAIRKNAVPVVTGKDKVERMNITRVIYYAETDHLNRNVDDEDGMSIHCDADVADSVIGVKQRVSEKEMESVIQDSEEPIVVHDVHMSKTIAIVAADGEIPHVSHMNCTNEMMKSVVNADMKKSTHRVRFEGNVDEKMDTDCACVDISDIGESMMHGLYTEQEHDSVAVNVGEERMPPRVLNVSMRNKIDDVDEIPCVGKFNAGTDLERKEDEIADMNAVPHQLKPPLPIPNPPLSPVMSFVENDEIASQGHSDAVNVASYRLSARKRNRFR